MQPVQVAHAQPGTLDSSDLLQVGEVDPLHLAARGPFRTGSQKSVPQLLYSP